MKGDYILVIVYDVLPLRHYDETLGCRVVATDKAGIESWYDIDYHDVCKAGVADEALNRIGLDLTLNQVTGMYETENEKESTVPLKTLDGSDLISFWSDVSNKYALSARGINITKESGNQEASMVLLTCRWVFGSHFTHSQVFTCAVKLHGEDQVKAIKALLPSGFNQNWAHKVDEVVADGTLWLTVELNASAINDLVDQGIFVPALSPEGVRILCVDRSEGSNHSFIFPKPESDTSHLFNVLSERQQFMKARISDVFVDFQRKGILTEKVPADFITVFVG